MSSQQMQILYKADISFYTGYVGYRSIFRKAIAIHLFQIIMFAIFIPIDCTILTLGNKMAAALAIAAGDSFISLLIILYVYYVLFSKTAMLSYCLLARDTNHATTEPVTRLQSIQDCTSETMLHFAGGVPVAGFNEQIINIYGHIACNEIEQINEFKYPQINWWNKVYNFFAIGSILIVIILLATSSSLNPAEIVILTVFLVLQAYLQLKFILILALVVISPILCVILLFYLCCCKPKDGRAMKIDLQPRPATTEDIVKSGGECSICLMNINLKENIYQLKCSDKHIFHQGCLQNWTRMKPNCPVCRADLPLTQANEQLHPEQPQ